MPFTTARTRAPRAGRSGRLLFVLFTLAGMAFRTAPVSAEEADGADAFNRTEAVAVVERIARDPHLSKLAEACPADVFARDLPWWRRLVGASDIPQAFCAAKPARCLDRCLAWSNPEACFRLALVFGRHDDAVEEFHKEALFTRACALGMSSGCTNRAAGIRNGAYAKDPFRAMPEAEKNACLHRSFKVDCEQDGAWGCAMLGQSYQLGEGIAADLTKARAAFEKSCAIDADFASCDFSREGIAAMDNPVEVDPESMGEAK